MKISAVIAEYNPFHLGHALHLAQTRKLGAEKIIVIMSGNFTQRGEAAIFDKFTRASAALQCGADMVLELPTFFALSSAQGFADGAIRILKNLNCISSLSFGCEIPNLDSLRKTADLLSQESEEYRACLHSYLSAGNSFPVARQKAILQLYGEEIAAPLSSPNSILALEYLQALGRLHSKIQPQIVLREGSAYLNPKMDGAFSSALAIREDIRKGGCSWQHAIPQALTNHYCNPTAESCVFPHLLYCLRSLSPKALSQISGIQEGLEHKLWQAGKSAQSYEELLSAIKSKRYPMARIKRVLCNLLLGITKEKETELLSSPLYARVLGIRQESTELLSLLHHKSSIPILCTPKDLEAPNPLLALDLWSTDFYSILQSPAAPAGRDYTEGLLRI